MDWGPVILAIVGVLLAIWVGVITFVLGPRVWIGPHERGVTMRGAEIKELAPGQHRIKPGADLQRIDTRMQPVHIPSQEIPTSEGVHARYGVVIELAVVDAKAYVLNAQNALSNVYRDVQLATRDVIAPLTCDDVRSRPAEIGDAIRQSAAPSAASVGITLHKVSLLDIQLPNDLKKVVAAAEIEKRNAQLQLDKARNEIARLRALANAANMLKDNPELVTLRRLKALEDAVANSKGSIQLRLTDRGE